MNNTSAYANVLLKTPVATPATVTPKRDYENDDASVDFQQTFKAAHDNQKAQDERVSKSANHKKSTQLERHSDTKNTKEIKEVKATNEAAAKQNPADNSTEVNRNAIDNELVREQPVQHKNKNIGANKATEGELDQDATNRVTDLNPDTLMTSAAVNEVGVGVIQSALVVDTALTTTTATSMPATVAVSVAAAEPMSMQEIPVATDIYAAPVPIDPATAISPEKPVAVTSVDVAAAPIAVNSIVPEVIDSRTPVSPLSVKSKSATALDVTTLVSTEPNSITLETEKLATVSPNPDASIKVEKSGEVISQPLVINGSLLEKNLSQPLADNSLAISVNQPTNPATPAEAQVLAASVMASAAPVKPLQPQVALVEMTEVSDEVVDLLAPLVPEVSASEKLAPANNHVPTSNTVNPEVTTAQAQMNASKSAFEKTLQTIVSPDASSADDMAAPVPNSSSTNGVTNPLTDSLMRGADQQTPAARSFVVQTAVPVPVGQPQWSQAVGEKVLWLAAQNVSSAEINLHPKDLGPMQVRVSVNQEQTTVSFTSQHAVVREVLDQNLNRLRDMFSEQGLNLVNVDVSDKSFSRQQYDAQDQKGQGGANDVAQDEETPIAMSAIVQQRLVDHYA